MMDVAVYPITSLTSFLGPVKRVTGLSGVAVPDSIIRRLRAEGVSIIYISHKMEEILIIADEVSIMRDGKYVGAWPAKELTTDKIISLMVGRDMSHRIPPKTHVPSDEIVMEARDITSADPRSFRNISFALRKGEILGIGGLVGAQRTELVESIFGLRAIESGKILRKGEEVVIRSSSTACPLSG